MYKNLLPALLFSLLILGMFGVAKGQLNDPTQPSKSPAPLAEVLGKNLDITAIFFSANRYIAVINGKLSKEGDIINGFRIVNIQPYAVKFRGAEGVFVKGVVSPRVKYPVSRNRIN
jgi:hypothetical protein